jgi:hypothetical protein
MTYRVLEDFSDKQDDRRPYKVGDVYPREGLDPSPQRIAELLGPDNARHRPVIEVIKEEKSKRQRKKG